MSEDQVTPAMVADKPVRRAPTRRAKVLPGLPGAAPLDHEPPAAVATEVPVPPAADPAVHPIEETSMADTTDMAHDANSAAAQAHDAAATAADRGRALFADWNSRTKEAMDRSSKAFEQLGDFYKGNLDALVESTRIAAKGLETMGQHAAELTRKSLEDATAATKTLSQSKSPTEFMKLQGDYARSAFDQMVAETSRSTETMLKLAGEVAQPMANRVAVAADRLKTVA